MIECLICQTTIRSIIILFATFSINNVFVLKMLMQRSNYYHAIQRNSFCFLFHAAFMLTPVRDEGNATHFIHFVMCILHEHVFQETLNSQRDT